MRWWQRLKQKWKVERDRDMVLIFLVFSLAGSAILWERPFLFALLGICETASFGVKFLAWLAVVFPCYQVNLLLFGALVGQFSFFWEKEKRLWKGIWRLLRRSRKDCPSP